MTSARDFARGVNPDHPEYNPPSAPHDYTPPSAPSQGPYSPSLGHCKSPHEVALLQAAAARALDLPYPLLYQVFVDHDTPAARDDRCIVYTYGAEGHRHVFATGDLDGCLRVSTDLRKLGQRTIAVLCGDVHACGA